MLKQTQYDKMAEDYQVNIDLAEWREPFYGYWSSVSKMPDDLKVILLTNNIIGEGIYQPVIKEVMRLETKYGNRRIKKSTIYEQAITNVTEGK